MKNVVLCCDGTANEFARDKTNVVKLFYTLEQDPTRQVAFYHPGLGTMEPPGALTGFTRGLTKLLGKAIGYGLENDVRDAYVFLMNHFEEATASSSSGSAEALTPFVPLQPCCTCTDLFDRATSPWCRMRYECSPR